MRRLALLLFALALLSGCGEKPQSRPVIFNPTNTVTITPTVAVVPSPEPTPRDEDLPTPALPLPPPTPAEPLVRWLTIPIPQELFNTSTGRPLDQPTTVPYSNPLLCSQVRLTLKAMTGEQFSKWIVREWPRAGLYFVEDSKDTPGLSHWRRSNDPRTVELYIPPPNANTNIAYINTCEEQQ